MNYCLCGRVSVSVKSFDVEKPIKHIMDTWRKLFDILAKLRLLYFKKAGILLDWKSNFKNPLSALLIQYFFISTIFDWLFSYTILDRFLEGFSMQIYSTHGILKKTVLAIQNCFFGKKKWLWKPQTWSYITLQAKLKKQKHWEEKWIKKWRFCVKLEVFFKTSKQTFFNLSLIFKWFYFLHTFSISHIFKFYWVVNYENTKYWKCHRNHLWIF